MPAWPEKRTHIGSHATRVDGPAKVTGAAKYTSDVQPEGWLYGMILSYGSGVEVIAPAHLREKIADICEKNLRIYR